MYNCNYKYKYLKYKNKYLHMKKKLIHYGGQIKIIDENSGKNKVFFSPYYKEFNKPQYENLITNNSDSINLDDPKYFIIAADSIEKHLQQIKFDRNLSKLNVICPSTIALKFVKFYQILNKCNFCNFMIISDDNNDDEMNEELQFGGTTNINDFENYENSEDYADSDYADYNNYETQQYYDESEPELESELEPEINSMNEDYEELKNDKMDEQTIMEVQPKIYTSPIKKVIQEYITNINIIDYNSLVIMEPIYKKEYENPIQYIIECLRKKNSTNKKSKYYHSNLNILHELSDSYKFIQNNINKINYIPDIYNKINNKNDYIINLFGYKGIAYIERKNNILKSELKLFIDLVILSYINPEWYENILEKYT